MRILFLSQRFLMPMDTGGKIRTGKLLEQLSRRHEITLVSNFDPSLDTRYLGAMQRLCSRFVPVNWRETPRHSIRFFARLVLQMFSRYPVNALNDYSRELETVLLRELKEGQYDLAVCDFVQSSLLFDKVRGIPRLLFQHNVEAMIPLRHKRSAGNALSRFFWHIQHRRLLEYEGRACRDYDVVVTVSEQDSELFRELYAVDNVVAIPTGVDVDFFSPIEYIEETRDSLVFCGSMDWLPNEDGIVHFLDAVLPRIKEKRPAARLTVIGRNPSPRLKRLAEGRADLTLTGWVDDTRPHLGVAAVVVVPLRVGGGTRMKIFESMAMGKAVISTSIGAEGLAVRNNHDIVIADTPTEFADATLSLLADADRRREIGAAGRMLVEERFSWQKVARVFEEHCETAVRGSVRDSSVDVRGELGTEH